MVCGSNYYTGWLLEWELKDHSQSPKPSDYPHMFQKTWEQVTSVINWIWISALTMKHKRHMRLHKEGKGPEHIPPEQTCFSVIIFQNHILTILGTEWNSTKKRCRFINVDYPDSKNTCKWIRYYLIKCINTHTIIDKFKTKPHYITTF